MVQNFDFWLLIIILHESDITGPRDVTLSTCRGHTLQEVIKLRAQVNDSIMVLNIGEFDYLDSVPNA